MKSLLLPCLLLAAAPAGAAFHIEPIKATHPNGSQYSFPRLTDPTPAAQNINTWLQATSLQKLPGHYRKVAFEDIWPQEDDGWQGITSLDYTVTSNEPGFLSLSIGSEYMAAYPSQNTQSYNFDARSGQPILLRDLFSADGLQWLRQQASQQRTQRIEDFLAGKTVGKDIHLRSDPEEAQAQQQIYQECLPYVRKDDLAHNEVQLGKDSLTLVGVHCAPHVSQALDDLWDHSNAWRYDSLGGQLSNYGRCLLIDQRTDCARDGAPPSAGIWRGSLDGRFPITLVLEREESDGSVSGSYFYDKYARYIELDGQRDAQGGLQLRESGPPPATFVLSPSGAGLSGTWQQDGKQALPIDLR
ncbi:hypothetical protein [Pseudomonas sp. SCB32]|uniref:hypothetical protein n=1 Tax=Pseudomonas sp. SCB32 TaxID=2653853 RepID=UPI0012659133|nr:hypothetical protein [Pseudomonas sp. SCB32]